MAGSENSADGGPLHSLKHCVELALNGFGLKMAAKIFIGMEIKEHLHGLSEAWERQDKTKVQEEIIALGNVFINARTHGLMGLEVAKIETFLSIGRAFDEGGPRTFENVELKAIQAIEARAEPLIQMLADTAFELLHPDAVPDVRVTGGDGPTPERRPIIVTPLPIDQTGSESPMKFDPVIITRGDNMKFAPTVVTLDNVIAGPDTVFEPVIITLDDAIAGPDTVFDPVIITTDDAPAGPNTQFDIDVVDLPQHMIIPPAEGMHIDSVDHMVITPAEAMGFIPEAMLSDSPGYSDTPDIDALQVPALDLTSFDLGAVPEAAGYLGGDLGLACGLDYGLAWAGGDDFGIGNAAFGGGDLPAFDNGGWNGDAGGWGGDSGGAGV